jgi:hypothetical protein
VSTVDNEDGLVSIKGMFVNGAGERGSVAGDKKSVCAAVVEPKDEQNAIRLR